MTQGPSRIKVIAPIPVYEAGVVNRANQLPHDSVSASSESRAPLAASFKAFLTTHDGTVGKLLGTNFWRVREGRFREAYTYITSENALV